MVCKRYPVVRGWVLALVFVRLVANSFGQATNISVLPLPEWVRPCEWIAPTSQPSKQKSEGSRYLLYERQENPQQKESFNRVILLMENQTGVQDSGTLTFGFDPSFQELILHRVQIHRVGKILDRLDQSKIKVIQPEPGLNGHIITGHKSALLVVEDLRIGDALEYAYTMRGMNPILDGHYSTRFVVQSSVPVDRQRMRVVWSSAKPLFLRQHLTVVPPKRESWNGGTEYVWDFMNLEGIPYEDAATASHEPYPYVELSDFEDWSRVVEWAVPLYTAQNSPMPPELRELIAKWQQGAPSNEERARLALEFVQDELRYTGIELGPDSYRPAPPFETFRLRYGDCKGKAFLFCTLLREMNIHASPALVNTSAREAVARRLPSPLAFNHVIVKVALEEGKTVWVDPTLSHQGGLLWNRNLPRVGKALAIKKGVTALEDIAPLNADSALQQISSTFKLSDHNSPVSFTVKTAYHGSEADSMREYFARTDSKEVAQNYLNFYARYYAGVHEPRPLKVDDDRKRNVLEVTERYQIRDFWVLNKNSQRWEAAFYADSLDKMLTDPNTRLRKMPLRITYPMRREHKISVHMPDNEWDEWDIPILERTVESDAFSFHYRREGTGSTVHFQYSCETKAPEVSPENVPEYLKKLDAMKALLGDTLFRPDNRPTAIIARINWLMVLVAGFGIATTLVGGIWVWRATRVTDTVLAATLQPPLPGEAHLQGLGGWLILVGFGLCLGPVWRCVTLVQNWEGFFSVHVWQAVAISTGEQYHPLYGPLLIFETLGNAFLLGLNVLVVCLFFAKRSVFPKAFIALILANVVVLLIDEIVSGRIPQVVAASDNASSRDLLRALMQALIWCPYMLRSRRVKATFVH